MKKKANNLIEHTPIKNLCPVVAIGASAGGLEAISVFLKNLPAKTGMAYVYIQHLDPTHESLLSAILSRLTKMKVLEAEDRMPVKPNHFYIIPPESDLRIDNGILKLVERKEKPHLHLPVDRFFTSLAESHVPGAIGIILSGNASDGTIGLKAIKAAGGLTFAQDESAKFRGMPQSAIREGLVDKILSPQDIAKEIAGISSNKELIKIALADANEPAGVDNDEDLKSILLIIKSFTGIDFTHYKPTTIRRRIIRRMLLFKLESFKDYIGYLNTNNEEVDNLYNDLLINVTNFFRDPDTLEYVKKSVFPAIIKSKNANNPIRIWVPACSTGEEAYSLAIILMEILNDNANKFPIQIFATDLSEKAIKKARTGLYSPQELASVSEDRIQKYFEKIDGHYRIIKVIKDSCVFAPHNLFKDPPFSRLDFISCCNLMIYLDGVLQKKILSIFRYALGNEGFLMLGKSENIIASPQLFNQAEKKYKVFTPRKDAANKSWFDISYRTSDAGFKNMVNKESNQSGATGVEMDKLVDDILLKNYIPASVLINENLDILQFRGQTNLFLEPMPGKASLNLLKMARPSISIEIRNAVVKASRSQTPIKKQKIEEGKDGQTKIITLRVDPVTQ